MTRQHIELKDKEKYLKEYKIDKKKLEAAFDKATVKLLALSGKLGKHFPERSKTEKFNYASREIPNWISGMYTAQNWLAYEYTGDERFRRVAESHMDAYADRVDGRLKIRDHDVGFTFSPSVVANYKVTGNEACRALALKTAEYFYDEGWSKEGKFIIRSFDHKTDFDNYRTMVDALLNAPFFFWAYEETGDKKFYDAAIGQSSTINKYLVRDDASTFHHYSFEYGTGKPIHGCTLQGYSDDSCWSRGHSWCVYGFPVAYSYSKEDWLIKAHRDVTYYFLNHLPENLIPCWDFIFDEPNDQPRDSSAALISVCGMHEMAKHLPDNSEDKIIFENASAMILDSVIDNCTKDLDDSDALVSHVTGSFPHGMGIECCATYADYFYMEALMRFLNPDWKMYW